MENIPVEKLLEPYLKSLSMVQLDPASVALAACGILCCFFGYRTTKLLLDVSGFVVLGLAASLLVGFLSEGKLVAILCALIIGGFLGAVIAHFAYRIGVMLFGCGITALVAWNWVQVAMEENHALAAVILGGLAVGLAAFFLERFTVLLVTAMLGGWFTVQGVFLLLESMDVTPIHPETGGALRNVPTQAVAWGVLTIVGFLFQLVAGRRKKAAAE